MQRINRNVRAWVLSTVALVIGLAPALVSAAALPPLTNATLTMRLGQRLSYLAAAATISSGRIVLVPDSNGDWVNVATGQKYSVNSANGSGGAGVALFDICTFTPTQIIANHTQFLLNTVTNSVSLSGKFVLQGNGSTLDQIWAKPANFAAYPDQTTSTFRVKRIKYTLDGRTFNAIRIQTLTGNGWTQQTFDLASGFLIISSAVTNNANGSTGLQQFRITSGKFLGNFPGLNTGWPSSLKVFKTYNWLAKGAGGVFGSGGVSGQAAFKWANIKWTTQLFTADVFVANKANGKTQEIAGTIGALWMRSSVLSALSANQEVDAEPALKYRVFVVSKDATYTSLKLTTATQSITYKYKTSTGDLVSYNTTSVEGIFGTAATITFVSRS